MPARIDMRVIDGVRYRPEDALRVQPSIPGTSPSGKTDPAPEAAKPARKGKTS